MIGKVVMKREVPEGRPIRAYRVWDYIKGLPLRSWVQSGVWKGGRLSADRKLAAHNSVGIHAYCTAEERDRRHRGTYARGSVLLWGTVFVHRLGYRAQHAEVEKVRLPNGRCRDRRTHTKRRAA
jgi:hypothetical protein